MDISNELVFFEEKRESTFKRYAFETFQKIFALTVLILFSPIFLVVMLAIKLDDPKGKIFYRGKRLGLYGREFNMFKFRTLKEGSEQNIGASLLTTGSEYITRIGKILRLTKIDEIPQFINVLKGEMNIIGPRPVRPILAREYEKEVLNYVLRFQVKPGISGPAQVFGSYYSHPREKLEFEVEYIFNRTFLYDIRIMYITFENILKIVNYKVDSLFNFEHKLRILTLKVQRVANLILFFLGGLI